MLAVYEFIVRPCRLDARNSGAAGGKAKAAKQTPPLRKACEFVQSEWLAWKKKNKGRFEVFWTPWAPVIHKKLKRIDPAAANTLRRGKKDRRWIPAELMRQRIRRFEAEKSKSTDPRNFCHIEIPVNNKIIPVLPYIWRGGNVSSTP
jgi:hypothetical protein